jgi:hypothetical protein
MATYLQGVTDYIPDYQPFQPDLNFYANVLQAKQNQYDSNWKQVNNLYAELHNADLTHDLNVKKKDDLLKQIDFNIKRVAGLDLSLDQNVNQATQVFRPFYEDKYLMKDMAWTKNYKSTLSRALNLSNSQDAEVRKQYWEEGIKEMNYRKQEFKDATLDETLNFGNVKYTPKVDTLTKYKEIFDKSGISMDIKDLDASGMYFVREKNGKNLLVPLQKLFMTSYINDPAMQAAYATMAYVKRKDYAEQNADKFNGNKDEAEKEYLRDQYKWLQNEVKKNNVNAQDAVKVTENKVKTVEKQINDKEANVYSESYLETLNKAMGIDKSVANHAEKLNNELNGDKTSSVSIPSSPGNPDELDLSNIQVARLKVDSAFASALAENDINAAADIYSYTNYVYEKSVNQKGLEDLRHRNSISRLDYASKLRMGEMQYKAQLDRENAKYERETARITKGLEDGSIWYDKDGNIHEDYGEPYSANWGSTSGFNTGEINIMAQDKKMVNEKYADLTSGYIGRTLAHLVNLANDENKQITDKELWNAVSFLDPNSKDAKERYNTKSGKQLVLKLWDKYNNDKGKFINDFNRTGQTLKLKKFMDSWVSRNPGNPTSVDYNRDQDNAKVEKFARLKEANMIVDKHNYNIISKNLISVMDANEDFSWLKSDTKTKIANVYAKYIKDNDGFNYEKFAKLVDKELGLKGNYRQDIKIMSKGEIESLGLRKTPKTLSAEYVSGLTNKTGIDIEDLYDNLSEGYLKASNKTGPEQLMSYTGLVKTPGGRYALSSKDLVVKDVIMSKPGYGGFRDFQQAMQDISRIRFGQDNSKYAVTYGGTTKTAGEKYRLENVGKIKKLLDELKMSGGKKSDVKFSIARAGMAMEDPNLRAFLIKPSKEILEKYFRTADGKSANVSVVNAILKNGISFIAPKSEWTNDFMLENELTPTEMILNATKKIDYVNGNGAGKYQIEKVEGVPGMDYRATYTTHTILEDGSVETLSTPTPLQRYGNNVDAAEERMRYDINEADLHNQKMYDLFQRTNDQAALAKVKEFFANPVKGGYQYK